MCALNPVRKVVDHCIPIVSRANERIWDGGDASHGCLVGPKPILDLA